MIKVGRYRKHRRIQEALDSHRMTFADVARELGVSQTLVSRAAHGANNNRRVLRRFLELGVRPQDLDLPDVMRAEGENNKQEVTQ
jgi:Transcriptional regulators